MVSLLQFEVLASPELDLDDVGAEGLLEALEVVVVHRFLGVLEIHVSTIDASLSAVGSPGVLRHPVIVDVLLSEVGFGSVLRRRIRK